VRNQPQLNQPQKNEPANKQIPKRKIGKYFWLRIAAGSGFVGTSIFFVIGEFRNGAVILPLYF
jgi:hypothetical protein